MFSELNSVNIIYEFIFSSTSNIIRLYYFFKLYFLKLHLNLDRKVKIIDKKNRDNKPIEITVKPKSFPLLN